MKPTSNSLPNPGPLLVFGAHPDDAEFGCGAILAAEARSGRDVHIVVCSRGEAGTHGTPEQRVGEAQAAAAILGAKVEFIELDGDSKLEIRASHSLRLASIIRALKPSVVLAPTPAQNQHPDHWRLAQIVRDACRMARFGGLKDLESQPRHVVSQLFFYPVLPEAEPTGEKPLLIDVSDPEIVRLWTRAMEAHASQMKTHAYAERQLASARVHGEGAGVTHAQPLYANDAVLFDSLGSLSRAVRPL